MHAAEREKAIMEALSRTGFVAYRELEARLSASPATIRRDLARLEQAGRIERVHGGAKLTQRDNGPHLLGTPFDLSITHNLAAKQAIGRAAAGLCGPGEGIIIDGGTTTFQMCDHLAGLGLQVLSNSLHIINALLAQPGTQLLVPSGTIFREQNIILAPGGEASMPRFHAARLFIGAAAIGKQGLMQADAVLVAAQRRFIECADAVVVLVDASKFTAPSGTIVCGLDEVDVVVTDRALPPEARAMLEQAGIRVLIAD